MPTPRVQRAECVLFEIDYHQEHQLNVKVSELLIPSVAEIVWLVSSEIKDLLIQQIKLNNT